jgi:coproporphyrinogen III oxidase-like Fe-S oxidoreductase
MQEMVEARLGAAGFAHYETSAFARVTDAPCAHNLNYWRFGDYLGIGAGAHGKLSTHASIWRETRHRSPRAYLERRRARRFRQPPGRDIERADLPGEFMMNALRLNCGFPLALFTERTGLPLAAIEKSALAARREGLLEAADGLAAADHAGPAFPQSAAGGFSALVSSSPGDGEALAKAFGASRP